MKANFFRLLFIYYILAKHGIDRIVFSHAQFSTRLWRFIPFVNPWNWFRPADADRGIAIRLALEELGPIFVKFGQVLSSRSDLLPADIVKALTQLQDNVAPFSTAEARAIVEKNAGKCIADIFAQFDDMPLAAASIAQVHAAVLPNGQSVIVKILRPHIRKKIQQDIHLLYALARLVARRRNINPKAIVREFEINLLDEIDLQREAGNASQLRRNFSDSTELYIPRVEWDYTSKHVMVMERIDGIPIADRAALIAHQVNLPKLAERAINIFFTQVFRDAFFHADMHPGNIFVSRYHPHDPQYICVDFGIMGTLTDHDKRYIAENLYAFFNRDYRRVAELHLASGWVNGDIRLERFESAIRAVSEPIFEKPLREISFAHVLLNLIQTAKHFHINIQPQLILLQKTLLSVEGLARYLDPHLDLWSTAKPFLARWIKEQIGWKAFVRNTQKSLPFLAEHLPELPQLLHQFLIQHSAVSSISAKPAIKQSSQGLHFMCAVIIGGILGSLFSFLVLV